MEGKGGRAKLIMIGGYPKVIRSVGPEYGLPPFEEIIHIPGGFDRFGVMEQPLDLEAVVREAEGWIHAVDAVAVVEHNGVANPANEQQLKKLLEARYDVPVVCGHELFQEYNVLGRAASALLNAKLIPVIRRFLDAIRTALEARSVHADTVIVRSDGSLMGAEFARSRPVETILCGPAASVLGGVFLTGEKDALLIDMGGTTTDIAVVRDGVPAAAASGVQIGAWRTFVKSVQIDTIGLGGDSIVTRNKQGELTIGPRRAMPLSYAATRWPKLRTELEALAQKEQFSTRPLNEYLTLSHDVSEDPSYSEEERALSALLREEGPLQVDQAATCLGIDIYRFNCDRLEQDGAVLRAALTMTDLMHLRGDFTEFDAETARAGAAFLACCLKVSVEELTALCYEKVRFALYRQCLLLLLRLYQPELFGEGAGEQLEGIIRESWRQHRLGKEDFFRFGFQTKALCVGLGAPTHIFLPEVAEALGTTAALPEHAAVANAVGAIVGSVAAACTVEIKPVYGSGGIEGYNVLGGEVRNFETIEEAQAFAEQRARTGAEQEARKRGVTGSLRVGVKSHEDRIGLGPSGEEGFEVFLGMTVTATAAGELG